MKHKFLAAMFALAVALCLCFGLGACGEKTPETPSDGSQTEQGGSGNEQGSGIEGSGTEQGSGEETSLAGKTFVFYDVQCEGMDATLLEEYRGHNRGLEYTFHADGTALLKADDGEMKIEQVATYTVNGDTVTITSVSVTMNGVTQQVPADAPAITCTFDGTNFTVINTVQGGLTLKVILRAKEE